MSQCSSATGFVQGHIVPASANAPQLLLNM